jgi:hypothetical protein
MRLPNPDRLEGFYLAQKRCRDGHTVTGAVLRSNRKIQHPDLWGIIIDPNRCDKEMDFFDPKIGECGVAQV